MRKERRYRKQQQQQQENKKEREKKKKRRAEKDMDKELITSASLKKEKESNTVGKNAEHIQMREHVFFLSPVYLI